MATRKVVSRQSRKAGDPVADEPQAGGSVPPSVPPRQNPDTGLSDRQRWNETPEALNTSHDVRRTSSSIAAVLKHADSVDPSSHEVASYVCKPTRARGRACLSGERLRQAGVHHEVGVRLRIRSRSV